MTTVKKPVRGKGWRIAQFVSILVLLLLLAVLLPWNSLFIASHPDPSASYEEAAQRIAGLQARGEDPTINPACRLQFLSHQQKTARVVVLVHGYTTCPQQFLVLGQRFYEQGYNVLIAPLPRHGLADRMNEQHAGLTAEELAAYADEVVDIADGLGEHVTIMGISAGGVISAWAAQNRPEVDQAILISPMFGVKIMPPALTAAGMNLYALLPNSFTWWDEQKKADTPPDYAYPRYSTHALTQIMRLGFSTKLSAWLRAPAAGRIVMVTNANDGSVNNELNGQVVKIWRLHSARVDTYEFDAALKLGHDLIDPTQADQQIDIVYPRLLALASE